MNRADLKADRIKRGKSLLRKGTLSNHLATATIDEIEESRASFWVIPQLPRSNMVFARTMTIPDTEDKAGNLEHYDPRSHPAQYHILKVLDGLYGFYQELTTIADAQSGKSHVQSVSLFHSIIERGIKAIYALPNRNLIGDIWSSKLKKVMIGAGFAKYLPIEGAASRDGSNPRSVPLRRIGGKGGGMIQFMSGCGRGESGQSALTARILYIDELDDWAKAAVQRIERRLDKFMSSSERLIYRATTVKADSIEASTGLQYYENSCKARLEYECEHCKKHTRLLFENFDHEKLIITCENADCGGDINQDMRLRMLASLGRLRMEKPDHHFFGLRWTALDCPWKNLENLAQMYQAALSAQALGIHEMMKQFYRDQRTEPYEDDVEVRNVEKAFIATRSSRSDYERGVIPTWADFMTYAIDVQMDRCYWLTLAVSSKGRFAIVDWGEEFFKKTADGTAVRKVEPTDEERSDTLDFIADLHNSGTFTNEEGEPMYPELGCVDMGYKPEAIGPWIRSRGSRIWAVRGDKPGKAGRVGRQALTKEGKVVRTWNGGLIAKRKQQPRPNMPTFYWFLRSVASRDRVRGGILLDSDKPGAICIPLGISSEDDLARHLSCWRIESDKKDSSLSEWVKRGARDDLEDCLIYAWNQARYILETKYRVRGGGQSATKAAHDSQKATPAQPVAKRAVSQPPQYNTPSGGGFIPL